MMDVDFLPRHLVVLGGSYIGLEFGQMYRRFGNQVTIVELGPRIVSREDEEVSQEIAAFLGREGIEVRTNANCLTVAKKDGEIVLQLSCEEGPTEVRGSHLLMATGRRPNTDDLGLERAGVKQDKRGYIEVDDQLQTSVSGIWALGDCNGRGAFTHTAWNDYEIVAANLLDGAQRRVTDRIPAYALFTGPQEWPARAGRPARHGERLARLREGRDCRLHEAAGRRRDQAHPRRHLPRHWRRRGDPLRARHHVHKDTVHGAAARRAHPSNCRRVHPHHARRPGAAL